MTHHEQFYSSANWLIKPGKEKEFIEQWRQFAEWAIDTQPGAIEAKMLQDLENPRHFTTFGFWQSERDINTWRENTESNKRIASIRALAEDFKIHYYKRVAHIKSKVKV